VHYRAVGVRVNSAVGAGVNSALQSGWGSNRRGDVDFDDGWSPRDVDVSRRDYQRLGLAFGSAWEPVYYSAVGVNSALQCSQRLGLPFGGAREPLTSRVRGPEFHSLRGRGVGFRLGNPIHFGLGSASVGGAQG